MAQLSVIIVSYNTRQMTLDCVRTLRASLGEIDAEIWLVDNASTDGSVDAIRQEFPAVRIIVNGKNVGFGAANNQAMKLATGEFFLLLNSDAFVKPASVGVLIEYLRSHPTVGAAGPRLLNADGSLQVSCYPFPTPMRAWVENFWLAKLFSHRSKLGDYRGWAHDGERMVDWVVGACLLVRREVYRQVGGFDERFFMYAEETDWQRRIRDAEWEIAFTPAAEVTHLGGTSGVGEKAKINRHFFASLDYYEWKHHGMLGLTLLRIAMAIGSLMRLCLWSGVLAVFPKRRAVAVAKVRLLSWLCVRQLTQWNFRPTPPHLS